MGKIPDCIFDVVLLEQFALVFSSLYTLDLFVLLNERSF
jgi:hypothetical protein